MKLSIKSFQVMLVVLYLFAQATPLISEPASNQAMSGMACPVNACKCKTHKAGQACCCLLMSHKATPKKTYSYKKGDAPCFAGDCGDHSATPGSLPHAKAESFPVSPSRLWLALGVALAPCSSNKPSAIPANIPEKVPLSV